MISIRIFIDLENPILETYANGQPLTVWNLRSRSNWYITDSQGGVRYAIVIIDYFTKWAVAEPLAIITTKSDQLCDKKHYLQV